MVSLEMEAASNLSCSSSGSSEFLNSSNAEIYTKCQRRVQNRRKTRRHQRFLKRKAFLQQRRLLNIPETGTQEVLKGKTKCSVNGNDQCFCEQIADMEMGSQIKTLLGTLPVAPGSSITANKPSTFDYDDSGLSVAGSSSSSRASSPLSWLKPGKCVAIDCEMVGTGPGGKISELARCSIVNYRGDVVYDKYIKPELPIADYRTRWSGITKHSLKNAIFFKTAQKEILKILKDKRVVGHALHNDFRALKYFHPHSQIRDTSKISLLKKNAGLPEKAGVSLKTLALNLLGKRIQVGRNGHSSVEDALASLELYKLVEDQWEEELCSHFQLETSTSAETSGVSDNDHYMDDRYWPADLNDDSK
ncbi:hypothetical protein XENTR_v10009326 [Xenopus tropicalis]|uniref:Exonuclease XPMC2 n=1 Tax=Xenopus tropicalis TaxID=8364 RepID=F6QSP9_XENTR|nr:apoptosis-enhancing nuclease isoform X1 [Xenopus tropicalis]KAE8618237.1 hypothetical protein XENTR_v10009326 [Xenopus tropicalis]KAE8618238.1 hypothetical protein XENTR_v10009326 [Xenopus tropicalis]